jgi:hypothetical protein
MTAQAVDSIAAELLARVPHTPDAYAQNVDFVRRLALVVLIDAASYRAASFLDDRMLNPSMKGAWVSLDRLVAAAERAVDRRPLHYIFHTGHVGSTLVSRLLDETGHVLSLREPLPLRVLADAHDVLARADSLMSEPQFGVALSAFVRLWSRGYAATRSVVLKATSSAGRLAPQLLAATPRSRAIYMNLRAEPYVATLLAGANSASDLRGHGGERIRRLQARTAAPLAPLHSLSPGELAAMSWLAEAAAQRDALDRFADRVIAVDFDAFLGAIEPALARILGHFELPHDAAGVAALARSPALERYSKAPEFAYTAGVRAEILRESRRDNGDEIRRAMAWLDARARSDALFNAIVGAAA